MAGRNVLEKVYEKSQKYFVEVKDVRWYSQRRTILSNKNTTFCYQRVPERLQKAMAAEAEAAREARAKVIAAEGEHKVDTQK